MGFISFFSLFLIALAVKGAFQSKEAKRRGNIELGVAALIVLIAVVAFLLSGSFHPVAP